MLSVDKIFFPQILEDFPTAEKLVLCQNTSGNLLLT